MLCWQQNVKSRMHSKWFSVGGYTQRVTQKEITCTCKWTTLEISRFPKHPGFRKDCKHIKQIREIMGQGEIIELLEKNKDWMTIKEMAKQLNQSNSCITSTSDKLYKRGEIKRKIVRNELNCQNQYMFKIK